MKGCNKGRTSKDMSARQGLRPIETDLRQAMQRLATGRTDEKLNERFGISYNSWRKIMAGQPVRISLAKRLAARISILENEGGQPSPALPPDGKQLSERPNHPSCMPVEKYQVRL